MSKPETISKNMENASKTPQKGNRRTTKMGKSGILKDKNGESTY